MTFILVIVTVLIILSFELVRRSRWVRRERDAAVRQERPLSAEVVDRYFHPAHSWARVETGVKSVTVGADDFAVRLVGTITGVDLPAVGQTVRQGERMVALRHGNRVLAQPAPISGTVLEVNEKLMRKPGIVAESPLDHGWVAKILPTNLSADLRNLLGGSTADAWRGAVRSLLIEFFSPKFGTVLQDGGQLAENIGDQLSDGEWKRLVEQFFPFDVQQQPQIKPTNEGVSP